MALSKTAKTLLNAAAACVLFGAGALIGAHHIEKPKSVIHVVTLDWTDEATDAQKKAALDGVANMNYPGLKRVWLRSIKSQTKQAAFAMEFESEKALADYADSPAQKEWYKLYLPIRKASVTSDITN
ncbi:MAG: Dabb family protein [Bryobacterales bacterium]